MNTYFICADMHDDLEALAVFSDYVAAQGADGIIVLGDLALRPYTKKALDDYLLTNDKREFIAAKKQHAQAILEEAKIILEGIEKPYFVIPGNYDSNDDFETVFGEKNLHEKTAELGKAKIAGYGGADAGPQHLNLLIQWSHIVNYVDREFQKFLEVQQPDIIISHIPPRELCDDMFNGKNAGEIRLTRYIYKYNPKLVLCGHIHEAGPDGGKPNKVKGIAGFKSPNNGKKTYVVNPGNLGRFEAVHPRTLETMMQMVNYGTFAKITIENDGTLKKLVQYTLKTATGRKAGEVQELRKMGL